MAAVAGAGAAGGAAALCAPTVRWPDLRVFPDQEVPLHVEVPAALGVASVALRLVVETPLETLSWDLGAHEVTAESSDIPVRLVYPYRSRVPGRYVYTAELFWAANVMRTPRPVGYGVRRIAWFS